MFTGVLPSWRKILLGPALLPLLEECLRALENRLKECGVTAALVEKNGLETYIRPAPENIFGCFKFFEVSQLRAIILGQDPYTKLEEANGLAFSVPRDVRIPPSLNNIYACLQYHKLLDHKPSHGDLTNWEKQGVLLLNIYLTRQPKIERDAEGRVYVNGPGGSDDRYLHRFWRNYTCELLRHLALGCHEYLAILAWGLVPKEVVAMVGKSLRKADEGTSEKEWRRTGKSKEEESEPRSESEHGTKYRGATNEPQSEHGTKYRGATNEPKASEKASESEDSCVEIMEWGHPSPVNRNNVDGNPKSFLYCDHFTRVQQEVQRHFHETIIWDPDAPITREPAKAAGRFIEPPPAAPSKPVAPPEPRHLAIFVDGACKGNHLGAEARAGSYAAYVPRTYAGKKNGSGEEVSIMNITPPQQLALKAGKLVALEGEACDITNNRGELLAVIAALRYALQLPERPTALTLVMDSEYVRNTMADWMWRAGARANLDLIAIIKQLLAALFGESSALPRALTMVHQDSHQPEPKEGPEHERWLGNKKADELCGAALATVDVPTLEPVIKRE